jgi:hypothetical protein
MNDYNGITNFDELIELEHGKTRTGSRNEYEENAQRRRVGWAWQRLSVHKASSDFLIEIFRFTKEFSKYEADQFPRTEVRGN